MLRPNQSLNHLIIIGGTLPAAVVGSMLLLAGLLFWMLPSSPNPSGYSGSGGLCAVCGGIGQAIMQILIQILIEIGKWMRPVGALLLGFLVLSRAPNRVLALFGIALNFSATLSGWVLMLLILAKAEVKPVPMLLVLGGLLFLSTCFLNTGLSSLVWLWKKVAESKADWWLTPLFNRPPPDSLIMFANSVIGLSLLSVTLATILFATLEIGLHPLGLSLADFLLPILFYI